MLYLRHRYPASPRGIRGLQPAAGYVTRFMPTCRRPLRPQHIGTTVAGCLSIGKYKMYNSSKHKKNDRPQSLSFHHLAIVGTLRREGLSNLYYLKISHNRKCLLITSLLQS